MPLVVTVFVSAKEFFLQMYGMNLNEQTLQELQQIESYDDHTDQWVNSKDNKMVYPLKMFVEQSGQYKSLCCAKNTSQAGKEAAWKHN